MPGADNPNLKDHIVWSGRGGGWRRLAVLAFLWLLALAALALSARSIYQGGPRAWLVPAFTFLVFVPIVLGFAFILHKLKPQRITIHKAERLVEFHRVFLLSGFLPHIATFTCRIDELLRIELARANLGPDWLYIHTPLGRVLVHSASENFLELAAHLKATVPKGDVPLTTRSWIPAILACAIVIAALAIAFVLRWLP